MLQEAVDFLKSLPTAVINSFIEKDLYKLGEVPINSIISIKRYRIGSGEFGSYPVAKASFGDVKDVSLVLPARFLGSLGNREFPVLVVYMGRKVLKASGSLPEREMFLLDFLDLSKIQAAMPPEIVPTISYLLSSGTIVYFSLFFIYTS